MEAIEFSFDVTDIDPFVAGGGVLPAGLYAVAISDMEVRQTTGKESHYLWTESTVAEGEHRGRKIYDNLNLWYKGNNEEKTVEIAYRQLSSIGHAVGVTTGEDLTALANIVHLVDLGLDAAKEDTVNPNTGEAVKGRGPQNRVLSRSPYDAAKLAGDAPANGEQAGASAAAASVNAAKANAAPAAPSKPASAPAKAAETTAAATGEVKKAPPPWKK